MPVFATAVRLQNSVSLDASSVTASGILSMLYSRFTIDATAGNLALTLPVGLHDGQLIWLLRVDSTVANTVTITPSVATVRDAVGNSLTTLSMSVQGSCAQLMYSNATTTWFLVGGTGFDGTM